MERAGEACDYLVALIVPLHRNVSTSQVPPEVECLDFALMTADIATYSRFS